MPRLSHVGLLALLLAGAPAPAQAAAPAAAPNIVFIFADDWGWGDLSSHGHPWLKTPHLDRLAREGIDFRQFNVLNPVCSPSRTAAMTGRFPSRYNIHQHFASPTLNRERGMPDWLDPKAPSVARFFQQAGSGTSPTAKPEARPIPQPMASTSSQSSTAAPKRNRPPCTPRPKTP
jgi:N-acetylgalactosamine-6-sulfatase